MSGPLPPPWLERREDLDAPAAWTPVSSFKRNAREAREEREAEELRAAAATAAQETTERSAEAQAEAAAKAQAEGAAAERAAETLRNRPPLLVVPLRPVAPEIPVPPPEEVGGDRLAAEREEGDVVVP